MSSEGVKCTGSSTDQTQPFSTPTGCLTAQLPCLPWSYLFGLACHRTTHFGQATNQLFKDMMPVADIGKRHSVFHFAQAHTTNQRAFLLFLAKPFVLLTGSVAGPRFSTLNPFLSGQCTTAYTVISSNSCNTPRVQHTLWVNYFSFEGKYMWRIGTETICAGVEEEGCPASRREG